jgi:release factor glutamine methyltransferase
MNPTGNLVKNLILYFRQQLEGIYPDTEIRQFIYILFEEYLGWTKTRVHLSHESEIPGPVVDLFIQACRELSTGKPVQYILQKAWFNGTLLKVDARVLVPRPETEEFCSWIKSDLSGKHDQNLSILDIGTGSGCIAIDLKKHFLQAEVTAIDRSPGALEVAGENARVNHYDISFMAADILIQQDCNGLGRYHVIVSNPPYVMESEKQRMHRNVADFEPKEALFVPDHDPLIFYRAITAFATGHLQFPGNLYFEINEKFGREVGELLLASGFENVRILHDLHGKERFVSAILKSPSTLPL